MSSPDALLQALGARVPLKVWENGRYTLPVTQKATPVAAKERAPS